MSPGQFIGRNRGFWGEQPGAFEQSTEIFFTGDLEGALLAGQIGHGFVLHLQPLQANDSDVLFALLPDLGLAQFHADKLAFPRVSWPHDY